MQINADYKGIKLTCDFDPDIDDKYFDRIFGLIKAMKHNYYRRKLEKLCLEDNDKEIIQMLIDSVDTEFCRDVVYSVPIDEEPIYIKASNDK